MQTISADEFKKRYGSEAPNFFNKPTITSQKPTYKERVIDDVSTDIANRTSRFGDILNRPDTGVVTKGVQAFGQGAGLAANTAETIVGEIPVVKGAIQKASAGINWLATSEWSPLKHLGDLIGESKTLQTAVKLYDTDQSFKDSVDAVANIVRLGGDVQTAVQSANFASNVTNKVIKTAKTVTPAITKPIVAKVGEITAGAPEDIMNRVARLKPTDYTKFEKMTGKTPGQYLSETGNFGAPDEIIKNEAVKFANSKALVDSTLEKLPGLYKDGSISDALKGLGEKVQSTSGENIVAPYSSRVRELTIKHNQNGLTMAEANEVKRLYERHVKLGYYKLTNADKVEQATNIDSALRNWQVAQAKKLGFSNIEELNKQTQTSKFIVDKLGDQVIGQSGLNGVSLTDWVVLSGGNPQAVAAFVTKKFLSSKSVQAKIAELLNSKEPTLPPQPNVQTTPESIKRAQSPMGLEQLPAPKSGSAQVSNKVPIKLGEKSQSSLDIAERKNLNIKQTNTTEPKPTVSEQVNLSRSGAEQEIRASMLDIADTSTTKTTDGGMYRTSSFPQWIPKDLRDSDLFRRVWRYIDEGTVPKETSSREFELYNLTKRQIDRRALELYAQENNWTNNQGKPITIEDLPF